MFSVILTTATRYLMPLLLAFSFFILLRGHNEPGGGFIGGLVAAAAYSLYFLSFGVEKAQKLLSVEPFMLIGLGLLFALSSGLIGVFLNAEIFLTGQWASELPFIGKLSSVLLFDIGVYLVVLGVTTKIVFTLGEEIQ